MFSGEMGGSSNGTAISRNESNNGGGYGPINGSSSDEAEKYNRYLGLLCIESGLVSTADFSGFDPRVSYDFANAIQTAKNDFPELEINYIGSIENQVAGIRNDFENSYYNYFIKTGFSEDQAKQLAKVYADEKINEMGMNDVGGTYAWSFNSGGALGQYDGVAVNGQYAKDYDEFRNHKQYDESLKWAPIGCGTPKAVADHELGHEIDRLVGGSEDHEIISKYNEIMNTGCAEEYLSGYSQENVREFIAEAYSEYRNNPNPRETSRFVYNRLIELRDQNILQKVKRMR